jgi:hypothetical protein
MEFRHPLDVAGSVKPVSTGDGLYDIGAPALRFRDEYLSRNLFVGGDVFIGSQTAPTSGLYQEKSGDSSRFRLRSYGGLGILFGERANGTLASPAALTAESQIFFFGAGGYDGTIFKSNAAGGFRVIAAENWSGSAHGAYLRFETTPNGATSSSERLRVDQNGYVGIGTSAPANRLHVVSADATNQAFKAEAHASSTVPAAVFIAPAGISPFNTGNLTSTSTNLAGAVKSLVINSSGNAGVASAPPVVSRVASDFSRTSNTGMAEITGLSADVAASTSYRFRVVLFTSSAISGGVKAAINGTCTATSIIYEAVVYNGATLASQERTTTKGGQVARITSVTVGLIIIEGTIVVNAAGTLTVEFAQNTSDASASTVLANSTFEVQQI